MKRHSVSLDSDFDQYHVLGKGCNIDFETYGSTGSNRIKQQMSRPMFQTFVLAESVKPGTSQPPPFFDSSYNSRQFRYMNPQALHLL